VASGGLKVSVQRATFKAHILLHSSSHHGHMTHYLFTSQNQANIQYGGFLLNVLGGFQF